MNNKEEGNVRVSQGGDVGINNEVGTQRCVAQSIQPPTPNISPGLWPRINFFQSSGESSLMGGSLMNGSPFDYTRHVIHGSQPNVTQHQYQ